MVAEGANLFVFVSLFTAMKQTFDLYSSRALLFTQLALLIVIPKILLVFAFNKRLEDTNPGNGYDATHEVMTLSPQKVIVHGSAVLVSFVFGIMVPAAMIQVVADLYTQQISTVNGSLMIAYNHSGAMFIYQLCYTLGLLGFFFVAILVAWVFGLGGAGWLATFVIGAAATVVVYKMLSLAFVLPILMLENHSIGEAMKRSRELVQGYYCYILGSMVLLYVVIIVTTLIYKSVVLKICGVSILASTLMGLAGTVTLPLHMM